jgi:ABC-type iron transport system FetAB ATPase subunit
MIAKTLYEAAKSEQFEQIEAKLRELQEEIEQKIAAIVRQMFAEPDIERYDKLRRALDAVIEIKIATIAAKNRAYEEDEAVWRAVIILLIISYAKLLDAVEP